MRCGDSIEIVSQLVIDKMRNFDSRASILSIHRALVVTRNRSYRLGEVGATWVGPLTELLFPLPYSSVYSIYLGIYKGSSDLPNSIDCEYLRH